MRVTDSQVQAMLLRRVQTSQSRMYGLQEQASTGRRVVDPADDPAAAGYARRLDSSVAALDSIEACSIKARTRLESADGTLGSMYEQLVRIQELVIGMANETIASEERIDSADRAEQIRKELVGLANTQVDTEYIFGGLASDTAPFQQDGTFVGDTRVQEVEISPGVRVEAAANGSEILTAAGGIDVLDVAATVRDALAADDVDALRAALVDIDDAQTQIRLGRSSLGATVQRVEASDNVRANLKLQLVGERSDAVDADLAETLSDMALTSHSLEAALAVSARSLKLSILDRL